MNEELKKIEDFLTIPTINEGRLISTIQECKENNRPLQLGLIACMPALTLSVSEAGLPHL